MDLDCLGMNELWIFSALRKVRLPVNPLKDLPGDAELAFFLRKSKIFGVLGELSSSLSEAL